MIRARFKANHDDWRPVTWPIKHPCWCTGYGDDYSIVVAYADSVEQLLELWPEAQDIDVDEVEAYVFSSRFPKPNWMESPNAPQS